MDVYKTKQSFEDSLINRLREKAYQEMAATVANSLDLTKKRIYSLNLPTGLGKTLNCLSFALKLREAVSADCGAAPRIIYSLPFLSIIDQNASVFEEILRTNDVAAMSNIILKHHHLSEISYASTTTGDKKTLEFETSEAKILIEGWNSEIIVTTFVQLFHTAISNKNRSVRKFHRLSNSIIILDEVQAIPVRYWKLFRDALERICEMLNAYIVLVTATEPLIFEQTAPLINKDYYFNALDRVTLKPMIAQNMTINDLVENFDIENGKTHLFIFNTITSAKQFYVKLKEQGLSSITYLSTHVTPKERLARINEIKQGRYKIVVTTQLVEAGVDIDFDIVVRDLAPLDSINQASGRCNRNAKTNGEVYVVSLIADNGRAYANYVYDSVLMDITKRLLSGAKEIKECEFLNLIDRYNYELKQKTSSDKSKSFLEAINKLRYDKNDRNDKDGEIYIATFKLIEDDYPKLDVFIELDNDAKNVWQKYTALENIANRFERKTAFDKIKSEFYKYVISIPKNTEPKISLQI
ncbi:metal dependent phosphohydrolase [Candidatus Magnetoovum chiemensis]|nr:metal dependent phosphohydrolase [Candidatus Magnetoovum chiemensis]